MSGTRHSVTSMKQSEMLSRFAAGRLRDIACKIERGEEVYLTFDYARDVEFLGFPELMGYFDKTCGTQTETPSLSDVLDMIHILRSEGK